MTPEFLLYPLLINNLTSIKTGNEIIDTIIIITIMSILFFIDTERLKIKIFNFFSTYFLEKKFNITFTNKDSDRSFKYKAIMYFLLKSCKKNITSIKENTTYGWDKNDKWIEESSYFEINQKGKFLIEDDIWGEVFSEKITKKNSRDDTLKETIYTLNIFSKTKDLNILQKWIDDKVDIYREYLKNKAHEKQLLITISYDNEDNKVNIESSEWVSYINFENSYFHDKSNILNKINFFLNNKSWYKKKGIPYNLGILLYGEPGGGKTRFIKQLLNHTKRHGLDIKLNNYFDFTQLKNIIYNDELNNDYIIQQDKRILIFEDIDAIGDVVKDRNKKKDKKKINDEDVKMDLDYEKIKKLEIEKQNNNLSYFLNIIDGLNECSGRIIVMTTNKIDYLDPALIRPGRIDLKIQLKKCNIDDIYLLLKKFWDNEMTLSRNDINNDLDNKFTSAEIINLCRNHEKFSEIKNRFL